MKVENTLLLTLSEDEEFTNESFDMLKDIYRSLGVINNKINLFCGLRATMRVFDYSKSLNFSRNGIQYTAIVANTLDPLSILIDARHGNIAPQPPTGVVEITEGDLIPRMSRELDELQQKWAMLNPEIRSVIDRRMLEMIQDGKITKKPPR